LRCKGNSSKMYCGRDYCPILIKFQTLTKSNEILKQEDFSNYTPPTIFIGSKLSYPEVNVGILSPLEETANPEIYDSPQQWYNNKFSIKQVVHLRMNLMNSRFKSNVYDARKSPKFLELSQEIGMSLKPVNFEVTLKNKPKRIPEFEPISIPFGPSANLKKLRITENPKIPQQVEKVFYDTDLKAVNAIDYLYSKGYDEHALTQLLTIGIMGVKKNRKLVPTRHSITAIDDTLGKQLIQNIKHYPTLDKYRLYTGVYFGNVYFILMFPEIWSYELFEMYLPGAVWNFTGKIEVMTDYENYYGRKNYASNCVGGYYSARLPILELLNKIKKQASCLVIRAETPDYTDQLGVWVCRSAGRHALSSQPISFETKESVLNYVRELIKKDLKYDIINVFQQSKLLKNINQQRKISEFV
ncbi:MAG: hypothetical protein AABX29_02490, partial [Nanoarchaeota archaeon]